MSVTVGPPIATIWSKLAGLVTRLHPAFLAIGVFFYTGAFLRVTVLPEGAPTPFYTEIAALMLVGGVVYTAMHWRACLSQLVLLTPFLCFVLLAFASAFWSQSPEISARRALSLLATILYAASGYVGVGPVRFMRIVLHTMLVLAATGIVLAVLNPAVGLGDGDYSHAVKGFYPQKNTFGTALLDAVLALSFLVLERGRIRLLDVAMAGALLVTLVLSQSTTSFLLSMGSLGITVLLLWWLRGGVWRGAAILSVVMAVAGFGVLASILGPDGLFALIGKDSTLTGRLQIWEAVAVPIGNRPWLGYGYAAFWLPDTREMLGIWAEVGWDPPSAHSAYFDMLLQLGEVGVGFVIAFYAMSFLQMVAGLVVGLTTPAFWMGQFLVVQFVLGRSESGVLSTDEQMVYWVVGTLELVAAWRRRLQAEDLSRQRLKSRSGRLRGDPVRPSRVSRPAA